MGSGVGATPSPARQLQANVSLPFPSLSSLCVKQGDIAHVVGSLWGHGRSHWQVTAQATNKCLLPPANVLYSLTVPVNYWVCMRSRRDLGKDPRLNFKTKAPCSAGLRSWVSFRLQVLLNSTRLRELGWHYLQVRQRRHVCKDALLEGGDIIAMQRPEERRCYWRQLQG